PARLRRDVAGHLLEGLGLAEGAGRGRRRAVYHHGGAEPPEANRHDPPQPSRGARDPPHLAHQRSIVCHHAPFSPTRPATSTHPRLVKVRPSGIAFSATRRRSSPGVNHRRPSVSFTSSGSACRASPRASITWKTWLLDPLEG